jgi:predicted TIM-barrel fold metal-dependent hydrolase
MRIYHKPVPQRRALLKLIGLGTASLTLGGCAETPPPERYNQQDKELLSQQRKAELAASGQSEYDLHRYRGYRGLSELPWFGLDTDGQLVVTDETIPRAIDMHCHLGMSVLFEPQLDLLKRHPRTQHLLDCDADSPGCELDLDIYANGNFTESTLKRLRSELRAQGLWGSQFAATQTVPNLLEEMDAMRVDRALLLPIKLGLWFGDDLTNHWRKAVSKAGSDQRLLCGCSIHPRDNDWESELKSYAQAGAKVIKLHPTVQRFYPDDAAMMPIYEAAQSLDMSIFFHGGRAGIEPESSHPFAMPRHYSKALARFPKLKFILGHAGARDHAAMFGLAQQHRNAWIGIHGQSLQNLHKMVEKTRGERLLFGTDWPFYHIGMSLAKVLIVTEPSRHSYARNLILRGNAQQFLADS